MVKERAKTSRRSRLRRKRKKEEVGGKRGQGEMEPMDNTAGISGYKASCFLRGSNVENQHNEPQFKHVLIVLEYLLPWHFQYKAIYSY